MTDREMLELAAKAVGGEFSPGTGKRRTGDTWDHWEWYGQEGIQMPDGRISFPLTDDGDALRLAVRCGAHVSQQLSYVSVMLPHGATATRGISWNQSYDEDPLSATRRAIVRAAAAIGEAMP